MTRRCASILRASLVDPAAETTNNHTHPRPRITKLLAGLESSSKHSVHVNNASSDQKTLTARTSNPFQSQPSPAVTASLVTPRDGPL